MVAASGEGLAADRRGSGIGTTHDELTDRSDDIDRHDGGDFRRGGRVAPGIDLVVVIVGPRSFAEPTLIKERIVNKLSSHGRRKNSRKPLKSAGEFRVCALARCLVLGAIDAEVNQPATFDIGPRCPTQAFDLHEHW